MARSEWVRARETFVMPDPKGGPNLVITAGSLMRVNDPRVKGRESLFEGIDEYAARLETAGRRAASTAPKPEPPAAGEDEPVEDSE